MGNSGNLFLSPCEVTLKPTTLQGIVIISVVSVRRIFPNANIKSAKYTLFVVEGSLVHFFSHLRAGLM